MKKLTSILTVFLITVTSNCLIFNQLNAQTKNVAKRNFSFEDAMKFELIRYSKLSNNGNWFAFETKKDRGDVAACINSTKDSTKFRFENGRNITFSNNSQWAAITIQKNQMEAENAAKKQQNNGLKLINLETKEEFDAENLQNYKFSEDNKWFAYQIKLDESAKPKLEKFKEKNLGNPLKLKHLNSGSEITIDWVLNYLFDTNSKFVFYTISSPNGKNDGIYSRELTKEFAPENKIFSHENTHFSNLAWNDKHNILAALAADLNEKGKPKDANLLLLNWNENSENVKIDTIFYAENSTDESKDTVSKTDEKSKKNEKKSNKINENQEKKSENFWYLPTVNKLTWNETKSLLYFGLKPKIEKIDEKEPIKFKDSTFYNVDTLLAKAEVHIWHWNDPFIMTQQQAKWRREKDKTYLTIYNLNENYDDNAKKYVILADTNVSDVLISKNENFALAGSDKPYRKEQTWYGDCEDLYVVNLKNGEKKKIAERLEENSSMSTSGNYVVFYKQKNWYLYDTKNSTTVNLTEKINTNFNDIWQDIPSNPYSNGFGGWLDDDKGFFLYDNWDIWYFRTSDLSHQCLTEGNGKAKNVQYRLRRLDFEKNYYDSRNLLIINAFNKKTKEAGIYTVAINFDNNSNNLKITLNEKIAMSAQFFRDIRKAKEAEILVFAKEQYDEFPNYYVTNFDFNSPKRITDLNLAIKDTFNWGTTELVEWKYNDTILQGYLVKPDNYNSSKKYPVMVYFYDQMSDRMNRFYQPELTHRPVNQIYMDNYVMFFCDIKYGVGSPGKDAVDCLLSGCRYLAEQGVIDTNKACLQGHSWGGYQTAFVVTQTDFFKAACAGAPVGNMTSAYSGIRLESGRTRQFQYEAQQSRIGGNLWDSLDAYIRNSPIFFANQMNTPFLIGFGDVDEAVPYQQGVELYMALRRAGKPAIMLQYVNEPHWVGRYWNKVDYSIKMKEFFDHYVLGTSAPNWITVGKPYKGEIYGK